MFTTKFIVFDTNLKLDMNRRSDYIMNFACRILDDKLDFVEA